MAEKTLTALTYLAEFKKCPSHEGIKGGTIHNFLRESKVKYYGGQCAVYYIEHYHNGHRCVIGGNYATNGKPNLNIHTPLDF